jgi:anti-sigma factor RsiW
MNCNQVRELISAYADGELDAEQRVAAEAHLRDCAQCSRALESLTMLKSAMQDATLSYNVPGALQKKIAALIDKAAGMPKVDTSPRRGIWKYALLAVAAGLVLAVGVASYRFIFPSEQQKIEAEAVADHEQAEYGHRLVDFASADMPAVLNHLKAKLNFEPLAPLHAPTGYTLIGGRVDRLAGHAVAVLVYKNGSQVSNIFQWPSASPPSPGTVHALKNLGVASWNGSGRTFYVVSDAGMGAANAVAALYVAEGCGTP